MQPNLPQTVIISLWSTHSDHLHSLNSIVKSESHSHRQTQWQTDEQMEERQELTGHWLIKMENHRQQ